MVEIKSLVRIALGLIFISCSSGPVSTEIDIKKNPVVDAPKNYQSTSVAIEKFEYINKNNKIKDKELKSLLYGSLRLLVEQKKSISNELASTNTTKN